MAEADVLYQKTLRDDINRDQRKLDALSTEQLEDKIRKDRVLPDTVTFDGKSHDIATVLRDPKLSRLLETRLYERTMRGDGDFSDQVALIREHRESLSGARKNSQGDSLHAGVQCSVDRVQSGLSRDFKQAAAVCSTQDFSGEFLTKQDRGSLNPDNIATVQAKKERDAMKVREPTAILGVRG